MYKESLILLLILSLLTSCMEDKANTEIDGLDDSVVDAIGSELLIKTHYGWGWAKEDKNNEQPTEEFEIQLKELWDYEGKRRGGIGVVTTENHPLTDMWVVFSTRHKGHWNFTDKIGIYNLSAGLEKPTKNKRGWPMLKDAVIVQGFGEIDLVEK